MQAGQSDGPQLTDRSSCTARIHSTGSRFLRSTYTSTEDPTALLITALVTKAGVPLWCFLSQREEGAAAEGLPACSALEPTALPGRVITLGLPSSQKSEGLPAHSGPLSRPSKARSGKADSKWGSTPDPALLPQDKCLIHKQQPVFLSLQRSMKFPSQRVLGELWGGLWGAGEGAGKMMLTAQWTGRGVACFSLHCHLLQRTWPTASAHPASQRYRVG